MFTYNQTAVNQNETIGLGTLAFSLNASNCDPTLLGLVPLYAVLGGEARITFRDGDVSTQTLGISAGAGTLGSVSAIATTLTRVGGSVDVPNPNGANRNPPVQICADIRAVFVSVLNLSITCRYTVCFDLNNLAVVSVGNNALREISYTGTASNGTITATP